MYKVCFYVPIEHLNDVKKAMFDAGGGKIGNYQCCSWEILGQGQFMPQAGSDPFIGTLDALETVAEYKVEMVCGDEDIHNVIAAMKEAHPYEAPAYQVIRVEDI